MRQKPLNVLQIEHIAIWVSDLEMMRHFYEEVMGMTSNERYHNPKKNFMSYFLSYGQGARIELMKKQGIDRGFTEELLGLAHFAISLGSVQAVEDFAEKLNELKIPILDGPRWTGDGYFECKFADPEGNEIEVTI